jgi:hypothetical protein
MLAFALARCCRCCRVRRHTAQIVRTSSTAATMGGARRYGWSGFTNTAEWARSLPKTFSLFAKRAGHVRDAESQAAEKVAAGVEMAQVLLACGQRVVLWVKRGCTLAGAPPTPPPPPDVGVTACRWRCRCRCWLLQVLNWFHVAMLGTGSECARASGGCAVRSGRGERLGPAMTCTPRRSPTAPLQRPTPIPPPPHTHTPTHPPSTHPPPPPPPQ